MTPYLNLGQDKNYLLQLSNCTVTQTNNDMWFDHGTSATTTYITAPQMTVTVKGNWDIDAWDKQVRSLKNKATRWAKTKNHQLTTALTTDYVQPRGRPPREFNKYINASDLLEEFIRYCGGEGLHTDEIMHLPIELFIRWLVIRACEEDQEEPPPEAQLVLEKPKQPRCLGCQRYMKRGTDLPLHNGRCAAHYYGRLEGASVGVRPKDAGHDRGTRRSASHRGKRRSGGRDLVSGVQ